MLLTPLEWAYRQQVGNNQAKSVLVCLAAHQANIPFAVLSKMVELPEKSLLSALNFLEEMGFLTFSRESEEGPFSCSINFRLEGSF